MKSAKKGKLGRPLVSVVLPCRDEEKTIALCIEKAKRVFREQKIRGEIIISDSSSDNSAEIASEMAGAIVIKHDGKGYGNAYLKVLWQVKGKFVILCDSDNTYDLLEMPLLLESLKQGYDFVIGSRFKGKMEKGSMRLLHKYIGNPFLNAFFNLRFGTSFSDTHCGFRGFRKSSLESLKLESRGMEFALEMVLQSVKAGLKTAEIPVSYYKRVTPSKLHSFRDGTRHMLFMLRGR